MNRREFENALMSTIVEYISDQVVLRYMNACKKATVLFSGALIGYADAVKSLNELKKNGWKLTAVLSSAAGEVLTEQRIREDINPEAIFVEGAPVNGRQIIDESQFVIIPELTINTAAKVANCISDNLLTNMIFRAMSAGKPVVAAIDGCCPDSEVRKKLGFKVTDAYKKRMRQNLEDIQSYGIVLTTDAGLSHKVEKVFQEKFSFAQPKAEMKTVRAARTVKKENAMAVSMPAVSHQVMSTKKTAGGAAVGGSSLKLDKKVVGRVDIAKNARYQTIIVNSDAIITSLARDEAGNRGIKIVKE